MHKESSEYGIELLFHNSDSCILCKQKKKKDKIKNSSKENKEKTHLYELLWGHKEKMKYQNLVAISKDEACKIFFGSLLVYKNRNFEREKIQILIISNNKEFKFDIYKCSTNQINIISKSGYYGLGIDDENKNTDLIKLEQIYIFNINKLKVDQKNRNILNFEIIGQEIENEKSKKKDKKKDKKFELHYILILMKKEG